MNKNTLKGLVNKENLDKSVSSKLVKYMDTLVLWSGYDRYYSIKEIAYIEKIKPKTVENRLFWLKNNFPDGYKTAMENRACVKAATLRLEKSAMRPVSYDPSMDEFIKEKF